MKEVRIYDVKELLLQVAADDESAFREVFDHFKSPFYAAALKMTRSSDAAEEIVQETFIKLWNKRVLVAAAKDPEAYLFKILHNLILNHFRKLALENQLKMYAAGHTDIDDHTADDVLQAKENRELLESIINQMPEQQRMVYRLSKQGDLSRDEIAARLNISPNTVKNHLAGAVKFLRESLEKSVSVLIWAAIWQHL